jgi:hypothetical protein
MSGQSYAGTPADPATGTPVPTTTAPQPGVSRRSVLRGAAGAGAAGLAAAAVAGTAGPALAAAASASSRREAARTTNEAVAAGPVVVHLRDARSGEMDVFAGTSHTRLRDPDLAARLARAAR